MNFSIKLIAKYLIFSVAIINKCLFIIYFYVVSISVFEGH